MIEFRSQRFACVGCIRGHRAVDCLHLDELLLSVRRLNFRDSENCRIYYRLGFLSGNALKDNQYEVKSRLCFKLNDESISTVFMTVSGSDDNFGNLIIKGIANINDFWYHESILKVRQKFGNDIRISNDQVSTVKILNSQSIQLINEIIPSKYIKFPESAIRSTLN